MEARVWNARLAHLACLYRGSLSHPRAPAPAMLAPNATKNMRAGHAAGLGPGLRRDSMWKLRDAGCVGRALRLAQVLARACGCRVCARDSSCLSRALHRARDARLMRC